MSKQQMDNILLNLVVIRSADIERLSQFYKLLGLNFTLLYHGSGPKHYTCELGMVVFEIYPHTDNTQNTAQTRIGFQVSSLDTLFAKLKESGVMVISQPKDSPWGRRAVIDDPDGNRVELVEKES